ncbi:hypothetical protein ACFWBC_19950 [Streptomyces sp. NPDC059985]|uniref:hypothetical protein n=1 Tax=Streptomyces sp. NPDC059985 TaxID=3347025 RepID=UPI00367522B1
MRNSTNPELQNAWDAVPEVKEAEARHASAQRRLRSNPAGLAPDHARQAVIDEVVTGFLTSGTWPKDVGKRVADAYTAALAWEGETLSLKRAEELARTAKEDTRDICADGALAFLGGRLTETLEAARTARDALDGVTSDAEAIEAGGTPLEAWRRLMELRKDLENLRSAQWGVLRSVASDAHTVGGWERAGHGEVSGLPVDEVPPHRTYDIDYLLWLAAQPTAYVPSSLGDLEADVDANRPGAALWDDSGPLRDMSPRVERMPDARPSKTFTNSRAAQLDHGGIPSRATANATPGDPAPRTTSY